MISFQNITKEGLILVADFRVCKKYTVQIDLVYWHHFMILS